MADKVLDTQGLICPLPVLRAKKAMKEVPVGGTLQVRATDPGSVKDFQAFCGATGYELAQASEADGIFDFLITKTA